LDEVFGPTFVADMALIGRDFYQREGAAVGLLFQARSPLFGASIAQQRATALKEEESWGAGERKLQIAGKEVSLLSTPDNRLRSFYVAEGDYHLVTTSRAIVERFLEVSSGQGAGSLGASSEFRQTRRSLPTSREDTVFVYLSAAFFRGLVSPQYQVELRRRLVAVSELELLQLARWAARAEGQPAESIEDLVRGGLLPAGFARRPDGNRPTFQGQQPIDSLRGGRGSFTPVPDVELTGVTRQEAARLAEQAAFHLGQWRQMDPLVIAVKRFALEQPGRERLVIEGLVAPFVPKKYGWLTSLLGPPTNVRMSPDAGDVITAQAVVRGGLLLPDVPVHHLFLGVQDHAPLTDWRPAGLMQWLGLLRSTPGYLGAWPKPGFLDWLPLELGGGPPDAAGYSRLPLGLWRRQWAGFSVLAFDPGVLAKVTPSLAPQPTEDEAQVRVHAGDLSQAELKSLIQTLTFSRAQQASVGNVKLLHALSQQLGVSREQALTAAEQLLDARLVCSLGGTYQLGDPANVAGLWQSTAWPAGPSGGVPADYESPVLGWFRGLDGDLTMYDDRVVLHGYLDLQRKPAEKAVELPFFNLFGAPKPAAPKPAARPPLPVPPPLEEVPARRP
jgi:hypothetical protein